MGVIDAGPAADSTIETPEPLPDWSFVWEIPIDGDSGADLQEQSDSADRASVGDPVQGPPGRHASKTDRHRLVPTRSKYVSTSGST
ncbi:hypothetical protein ACFQL7_07500 [Halocatena marina]|uniref:Uncharacterized protein n=1 Tax=Halocatena marina TaxID=2934937 RepID=A0ABD5YMP2_9EURY